MTRPHPDTPQGWAVLMAPHWHTSTKVVNELWSAFCHVCPDKVATLSYQLAKISDVISGQDAHVTLTARMEHYIALLGPKDLLKATLTLSPETGRPRRREIVALEGVILGNVTATGQWK